MKITFILPSVGRKANQSYVKTWQMEPLQIAQLAGLTPKEIELEFFDDRIEEIDYNTKTDLVAMSVETYTARRAYEISKKFRRRGIKVIMGGFNPTLAPNEALNYADSIVIGEVEDLWSGIITDLMGKKLKRVYTSNKRPTLKGVFPDRSVYKGKKYLDIGLIETGRGCAFNCDFCSIASFYNHSYMYRPIEDVVKEIKSLNNRYYFLVDDNIYVNANHAKELFEALLPLKKRWACQGSVNIARDKELLELMKKSGCEVILIGFESLNKKTLATMNKKVNIDMDIDSAIRRIHDAGIKIYATFVFGYDEDTPESFKKTFDFAMKHKFFLAAFNHLVPFPGTLVYQKLKSEKRLLSDSWWLNHAYSFGQVAFKPKNFSPEQLASLCYKYRRRFYSTSSILYRLLGSKTNFSSITTPFEYLFINYISKIDVRKRQNLPMGKGEFI